MGRKRESSTSSALPRYVYRQRKSYYFRSPLAPRKWIALGSDLPRAMAKYATLLLSTESEQAALREQLADAGLLPCAAPRPTLTDLWDRYSAVALPQKAPRTQSDNRKEAALLLAVFGSVVLDDITAVGVRTYLDTRGAAARTRANREVALLSHMLNRAREWGMMLQPNPCAGVKKFKEPGRDRYVSDEEYVAVWRAGDQLVRDTMGLAYLLGQRPQDVFALTLQQVSDGVIAINVTKTKQRVRIVVSDALAGLLDELQTRLRKPGVTALLVNSRGAAATPGMFRSGFDKARAAAGVSFQLRDLRAKNATDTDDLAIAQKRLAHTSRAMTEHYVRSRQGERVAALDRRLGEVRVAKEDGE